MRVERHFPLVPEYAVPQNQQSLSGSQRAGEELLTGLRAGCGASAGRGMRGFVVLALLLPTLAGCSASTRFVPPKDHRAYLVVVHDEYALMRDSTLVAPWAAAEAATAWDPQAQAALAAVDSLYGSGQVQLAVGGVLLVFVPPIGLAVLASGETKVGLARARLIDAMNIQNDAEAEAAPLTPDRKRGN